MLCSPTSAAVAEHPALHFTRNCVIANVSLCIVHLMGPRCWAYLTFESEHSCVLQPGGGGRYYEALSSCLLRSGTSHVCRCPLYNPSNPHVGPAPCCSSSPVEGTGPSPGEVFCSMKLDLLLLSQQLFGSLRSSLEKKGRITLHPFTLSTSFQNDNLVSLHPAEVGATIEFITNDSCKVGQFCE